MGTLHNLTPGRKPRKYDTERHGEKAEQAGAGLAYELLEDLAEAETQGDAVGLIQDAVLDLAELPRRDAAAAGFAVVLCSVLLRGLRGEDAE